MSRDPDAPPRPGRRFALRFAIAGVVVLASTGAAVATTIKETADSLVAPLQPFDPGQRPEVDVPKPGQAQTILLTGLDHRYADGKNAKSRSDTMILVRLDPDAKATTILSLPRDLRVPALGPPGQDKLNMAWYQGGGKLLTKIIRTDLLGTPTNPFRINEVVSVKFDAFSKAVNYFGCLYADIDRKYFIPPNSGHAAIDQPSGYQLLCGQDALSYVRFRVQDSDFIREARQANYLSEARSQVSPTKALSSGFIKQVGKYVNTNIDSGKDLLGIAKLAVYVTGRPTDRIKLGDLTDATDDSNDVLTTPQALAKARQQFLNPQVAKQITKKKGTGPAGKKRTRTKRRTVSSAIPSAMTTDTAGAQQSAATVRQGAGGIGVLAPSLRFGRGAYEQEMSHGYDILDKSRKPKWPSYRIVATTGDNGQYYGIEGTTWKKPPILDLATDEIRLGGRTWQVQYDGKNIRRLSWKAPNGTYWISNTLTDELSPKEMYSLARSMKAPGG